MGACYRKHGPGRREAPFIPDTTIGDVKVGAWPTQIRPCQEKSIRLVVERLNCSALPNGQALPAAG